MANLKAPTCLSAKHVEVFEHIAMMDMLDRGSQYYSTFTTEEEELQTKRDFVKESIVKACACSFSSIDALLQWKQKIFLPVRVHRLNVTMKSFQIAEERFAMWFLSLTDHTFRDMFWVRSALTDRKILFPDRLDARDWAVKELLVNGAYPDASDFEKPPPLDLGQAAMAPAAKPKKYVLSQYAPA
jgi:hypothetical protein